MIKKLFPLLFIIFVFAEIIYLVGGSFLGLEFEETAHKVYIGIIGAIGMFSFIIVDNRVKRKFIPVCFILVLFGLSYYMTSLYYGFVEQFYWGHFLRWGANCISATFMGYSLVDYNKKFLINRYIPYLIIVLTLFIASVSLTGSKELGQYIDEYSGLNYQVISYLMAFLFAISAYYLFIVQDVRKNKLMITVIVIMMITECLVCATSGGRGGFVLMILYMVSLIYVLYKYRYISREKLYFIVIFLTIVLIVIANIFDLWNYEGSRRIISLVEHKSDRTDQWNLCLNFFYASPIWGNGLGSDFYTFGFYTHNVIVDFLVEGGLIGFVIFSCTFVWMELKIIRQIKYNRFYVLIAIIALYGLVFNMFSGYWISTWQNWFIFGVAYRLKVKSENKLISYGIH